MIWSVVIVERIVMVAEVPKSILGMNWDFVVSDRSELAMVRTREMAAGTVRA